MTKTIQRCSKCIMPASVPGLSLDKDGVCNFCREFKEITYRGKESLDKIIASTRTKGGAYDCIVPMSGGRDSTYALYVARKLYNLKTLAVNYDNEFRHDQALLNMQTACSILGTEFVTVKSKKNIARQLVLSTIREEISLGNVKLINTCKACSYNIKSIPYRLAEQFAVPLLLYAGSQEEKTQGMIDTIIRATPVPLKRKVLGKLNRLNPYHWNMRYHEVLLKYEFMVSGNSPFSQSIRPTLKNKDIQELHLFDYIPWDRKTITATITQELGWKRTPGHQSSWRNDCALHQFVNYDFITRFGCTRDCLGYCRMINAGKMTREEALKQEEEMIASYADGIINNVNIEKLLLEEVGISREECKKIITRQTRT